MPAKPKDNTPPGWKTIPAEFFHVAVQASLEPIREECEASSELVVKAFPVTLWKTALAYSGGLYPMPPELSCDRVFVRLVGAIITAQDEVTATSVWRDWRQQCHYDEKPLIHPGEQLQALQLKTLREGWQKFTDQRKSSTKPMGHEFKENPVWSDPAKNKASERKVGEVVDLVRKSEVAHLMRKSEGALYVEKSRERKRMTAILERWRFAYLAWYEHSIGCSKAEAKLIFRGVLDGL